MQEAVQINFEPGNQLLLNVLLAFIMFGVALDLSWNDITNAFKNPKAVALGLASQFILMPALTFLLVYFWRPDIGLALGLILVAACPGGNISNFISSMARADVGLSVTLTAASTLLCLFFTPLNFEFWAKQLPEATALLRALKMNPIDLFQTLLLLLFLPAVIAMTIRSRYPKIADWIQGPIRKVSILVFIGFIVVAFMKNTEAFVHYLDKVFLLVMAHNLMALVLGYALARLFRLQEKQCRTISIETGIQNAGLGLVLCFNFFPGIGEMALVCAWWGIWHIISGMGIGYFWSRVSVRP